MFHLSFRTFFLLLVAGSMFALTACDTYSYPTAAPEKEQMKENKYVYGDPDGPPNQTANKYPADPDAAAKAALIKQKLFAKATPKAIVDTAAALRSAQE